MGEGFQPADPSVAWTCLEVLGMLCATAEKGNSIRQILRDWRMDTKGSGQQCDSRP